MGRRAWIAAAVLLLAAGCTADAGRAGDPATLSAPAPAAQSTEDNAVLGEATTIATGLEVPWAVAFLPDGAALVSERDSGRVLRVEPDGAVTEVGIVPGVVSEGEGGLLGLAVSPDFSEDSLVYAYLTTESDNRIIRMPYDPDNGLGAVEVVVDSIPKADRHNGGQIAFGPDGMLYAGTGDAGRAELAQDTDSLAGKILRMTPDGAPAADAPFDNLVYSYGHRNVQGLAWDADGTLYATEFGQDTFDEVNVIIEGGNYGWPEVEGTGGAPEYTDPVVTWSTDEASPSGAAIAGDALWVAALRGERLWRIPLTGNAADPVRTPEAFLVGDYGRLRAVAAEPGGQAIWITTSNRDGRGTPDTDDDMLLRIPLGTGS